MTQTATILAFVSRDDPQRLHRLQKARIFKRLMEAEEVIAKGIRGARSGDVFMIEFGSPLESEECSESEVEKIARAWLYRYHPGIELERYESSLRRRGVLHVKVK